MYDSRLKYSNLTNEFQQKSLDDNIKYDYIYKDLQESNEIPRAYLNKPRIIKEQQSVGGFRIPEEKLKKYMNPSDYMPLVKDKYATFGNLVNNNKNNQYYDSDHIVLSNNNNNNNNNNEQLWSGGENVLLENYDENDPLSEKLISVFEQEVFKLKQEAEEKYNLIKNKNQIPIVPEEELNEEKVYNQYLAYNPSRVQAIKHVTTNFKPEYLSLDEIRKQREEHMKLLLKTENQFYEKKKKGEQLVNLYNTSNFNKNKSRLAKTQINNIINTENNEHFDIKEIEEALKNEEKEFKNKKLQRIRSAGKFTNNTGNYSLIKKNRSLHKLRKYNDSINKPLNRYESKYIKKFMNFLLKKKYLEANDEEFNDKEDWNSTRVRSYNVKAINTNKEGLAGRMDSGHLDRKDYSLYYLSIDSDSPRSLSLKSGSSRVYSGQKVNRKKIKAEIKNETFPVQYGSAINNGNNNESLRKFNDNNNSSKGNYNTKYNSKSNLNDMNDTTKFTQSKSTLNIRNSNNNDNAYNSHLAFFRMIFHLLDINKEGVLNKVSLKSSLNLDPKILEELGFENQEEFLSSLLSFQTNNDNQVTEEEFVGFLFSKTSYNEEFLENYKNNRNNWDNISNDGRVLQQSSCNFNNITGLNFSTGNNFYQTNMSSNNNNMQEDQVNYNSSSQHFHTTNNINKGSIQNNNMNNLISYNNTNTNFNSESNQNFRPQSTNINLLNKSHSITKFNSNLNTNQNWNNKINKYNVSKSAKYMMNLKKAIVNEKLKLSYNDYKDFMTGFKPRNDLNITIPNPPSFYNKKGKKEKKIQEILNERKQEEDEILNYRFRPNELKREIFISQFENIIVAERERRIQRCEKLKQRIVQDMRPFSFYEVDEKKYKEKLVNECMPPEFLPFKANPIPWTSQVNLFQDMLTKKAVERNQRVEERARHTLLEAKLPPRMEMHEKKKKLQEEELKSMDRVSRTNRSKSFKANKVPNFARAYESFMNEMEKKKSIAKPTEPKPFTFHEPKKNASLRDYLDNENDPQAKNPQFKKNIEQILKKIQQKPKIEPASTKSLDLLMATRRKELEDKQRKEELKKQEDLQRQKNQNKLKERVVKSKYLIDNKQDLESKRKEKQENFKQDLKDKKKSYMEGLERRKQKIYNKPLMFEQSTGNVSKLKNAKKTQQAIYENVDEVNENAYDDDENYKNFDDNFVSKNNNDDDHINVDVLK